jgi:hypothetical protein
MRFARVTPAAALLFLAACTTGEAADAAASTSAALPSVEDASPSMPAIAAPAAEMNGEPFSLYVHCGISTTEYAGRNWVAVQGPVPQLPARANAAGISVANNSIDGVMTQIQEDRLKFVALDPHTGKPGVSIEFLPAPPPVSHCE